MGGVLPEGYKDSVLGAIPIDWDCQKLGFLLHKIVGGGTPSKDKAEYWGGDIPWASVKDFTGVHLTSTEDYITIDGLKNSASNLIPAETLITPTRMALGKAAFFDKDVAINQDLKALIPTEDLNKYFLLYWFQVNTESIETEGTGSTVKGIRLEVLKDFVLALPPLPEQKKIARILSTVDSKLALIDQQITATQTLKKGLMQKLFSEGVGTQDGSLGKEGNWQPHTEFKDSELGRIPAEWEVNHLEEHIDIKHGWAFPGEHFGDKGPILLTPGNFLRTGDLYFNERNTKRYSGEYPAEYEFQDGDLVVVMTDLSAKCEILGNMGVIKSDELMLHNQRIGKIQFKGHILNGDFIKHFSQSSSYKAYIQSTATGTTVRHSSPSKIGKALIAVPPIEEQSRIVHVLSTVDKKLEHLTTQKTQTKQLKKGLMQKLLTGQIRLKPDPQDH